MNNSNNSSDSCARVHTSLANKDSFTPTQTLQQKYPANRYNYVCTPDSASPCAQHRQPHQPPTSGGFNNAHPQLPSLKLFAFKQRSLGELANWWGSTCMCLVEEGYSLCGLRLLLLLLLLCVGVSMVMRKVTPKLRYTHY